jgi:UDP-N-acetylmuramyl pentapeptide phosphotransferase/UDP-N-acetylglucosamine-1-phosphate transferase
MSTLALALLVVVASYAGVEWVRRLALRRGVLDVPVERSSHRVPTPRGGGIVIVVAALLAALLASGVVTRGLSAPMAAWLAGGAAIAVTGWMDDVRSLSSRTRLAVQLSAAVVLLAVAGCWSELELPLAGRVPLGWGGCGLALLWIVGMTNAYNFMDGIDGIAAGQAIVAGIAWALIGGHAGDPGVRAIGAAIALSGAGFLLHNRPPARIFMGDVGSGFLGFTVAALPLLLAAGANDVDRGRLPVVAAALVWPFLFDATFTFIRRLARGENVFDGHRSHLYQRLVISGVSHGRVSALYMGWAIISAVLGLLWLWTWSGGGVVLLGWAVLSAVGMIAAVRMRERRP